MRICSLPLQGNCDQTPNLFFDCQPSHPQKIDLIN